MRTDFTVKLVLILLVGAAGAWLAWPMKDKPGFGKGEILDGSGIQPGIDIQGGAELTYHVLFDDSTDSGYAGSRSDAAQEIVNTLKKRIDIKGLKEPNITTFGNDRIIIQLPGVDRDALEEYKKLIITTGNLELVKVGDMQQHADFNDSTAGWALLKADGPIQDGTDKDTGARLNYSQFRFADQQQVVVQTEPVITGRHIEKATPVYDPQDGWMISFTLNRDGEIAFRRATGELVGQQPKGRIAIVLDKTMLSMPSVQSEIGRQGVITGDFSDLAPAGGSDKQPRQAGAEMLGIILEGGELPYPIGSIDVDGTPMRGVPEQETFVGPTLGADAIRKGLTALAIAAGAVALFMIVYYRGAGVVAVIALLLNLCVIGGIMSLFGATLTLAGMAGIVLTVGMAVDANILVFERVREELDRGKTAVQAFEQGGERAVMTILDANITTFIIGIVLYYIAIGPVKGFAITLMIGIASTLLCVLVFGKAILRGLISSQILTQFSMMRIFKNPSYKFVRTMPAFGVFSILAVLAAVGFVMSQGGLATPSPAFLPGQISNAPQPAAAVLHVKGTRGEADVTINQGADRKTVVAAINEHTRTTGVLATPDGHLRSADSGADKFIEVSGAVAGLEPGRASGGDAGHSLGIDFKGGSVVTFTLRYDTEIEEVRKAILGIRDASGIARYSDLSLQTVADPEAESALSEVGAFRSKSRFFQMRTSFRDKEQVKADLQTALSGKLPPAPFLAMQESDLPSEPLFQFPDAQHRLAGSGLFVFLDKSKITDKEKAIEAVRLAVESKNLVSKDVAGIPAVKVIEQSDTDVLKLAVVLSEKDAGVDLEQVKKAIQEAKTVPLTDNPFSYDGFIGPTAARDLRDASILALLVASAAMLGYVALRFLYSWKFGVAAVVPLIHDAFIALGVVALCNAYVPASWGLNFEINMPTVAAILTIVGYSINDTIIVFDRIRENLVVMKHAEFADIINDSVNQTLSRTLLTSGTTLLSVIVLYVLTAGSGGGIAEFSFPMIVGIVVGTYSSIWVGAYMLKLLYGKERPKVARAS